ncbi:acyl-CoA thioesterase [Winogradskyella alexanderae]|uniref:Acyl-CoA thioesterase n=1 Tax=Winogradskyella alexanderae TaxID=2877123 RepID=A0ABS7XUN7_9FLAO|nr:acyl-ACP thioesterase domain-containing protein [Winogradskyella alexanderae]MCA0133119.1 acyl-CoA thioesterase [Winogradskyella alexanderae]
MQVFEKTITVSKNDLDQLNHVNNVRYVQWVQDIAEAHWNKNAGKEILQNYYWVLVKHIINYKNQAVLGDVLKLKTYVISSEGVTSIRIVEIHNATTNKLLVNSETKWCLMDKASNRPRRIPSVIAGLFD